MCEFWKDVSNCVEFYINPKLHVLMGLAVLETVLLFSCFKIDLVVWIGDPISVPSCQSI